MDNDYHSPPAGDAPNSPPSLEKVVSEAKLLQPKQLMGQTMLQVLYQCKEEAKQAGKDYTGYNKYINLAKQGINPLHQIVADAEAFIDKELIQRVIDHAKRTGEWWEDYKTIMDALEAARDIHKRRSENLKSDDISEITETHFTDPRDADLVAHALFIDPKVRELFKDKIEYLYRAKLRYHGKRRSGPREKHEQYAGDDNHSPVPDASQTQRVLSEGLERLIAALPAEVFSKDDELYNSLRKLIRKKANRDALVHFKKDTASGLAHLAKVIAEAKNENIKIVYQDVLRHYERYATFGCVNENKGFRDPVTGQTGTFPSLHQRIGVYHALDKQRFGVLDGCGTGKTAIGALLYPLVQQKKQHEGKRVHNRIVIVGTIPCFKTWQKGFEGRDHERYLAEKKNVVVINGHSKGEKLLEELKNAEVVFANYQQLNTQFKVNGGTKPVYKVLSELGFDVLVFDEVHNIKNRRDVTGKKGRETHSYAARYLAACDRDAYFLLLSGTPMPDNLRDYGVIYHLLRPDECANPDEFVKRVQEHRYNPHMLATFVDENTLRRTAEEVNDLVQIDKESWFEEVELTDTQRKIHDYLASHRPLGWVMEARKALLDPRLVNPAILNKLGLLGKVGAQDSAKYKRLEEMLTADDGPVRQGEKFVIFSSVLKEGITRIAQNIAKTYRMRGFGDKIQTLGLGESLETRLSRSLKEKFGKDKYIKVIDGQVSLYERERIANQFKNDPNFVGVLCTTDTGGESLDFSNATHGYFLDQDFSPATTEQAIARLWRRGQSKPVTIKFLRGFDSIDASVTEYVERKDLAIKIALDGHPLTEEEEMLLSSKDENSKFTEFVKKRFGGIGIDASEYQEFELSDVVVKSGIAPKKRKFSIVRSTDYDTTRAQAIGMRIAQDRRCWFDPMFAKEYLRALNELSPYIIHRMKIIDLLKRAQKKDIIWPEDVLSLGSGPGILWGAYQDLADLVQETGFAVPAITDLDYSDIMFGKNMRRICADMRAIPVMDGRYSMIDNASLSLLANPQEVERCLRESNRILKNNGLLELSVKSMYFKDGFHHALEQLGFEPLTRPHAAFHLSRPAYRKIAEEHGPGFADACQRKLDKSHFILARKVSQPKTVKNTTDLWFWTELGDDHDPTAPLEQPMSEEEEDANSAITRDALSPEKRTGWNVRQKRRWRRDAKRPEDKGPTYDKGYSVNKDGTVDPIKPE